jgi:amidophosphoribosyltransferase
MKGNMGIACISDYEAQPILIRSHHGTFAITTVGKINNAEELANMVTSTNTHFFEMNNGEVNPTELVAALINQKGNFVEGIEYAQNVIDGSISILILTPKGIYAARDKMGRTPIAVGQKSDGYCYSFESFAYLNLGYNDYKQLGPGEITVMDHSGVETLVAPGKDMKICTFLWVYYGYPSAFYEGINVEDSRYRCGAAMAKRDKDLEVDFAAGIPDSGVGHAIGYSNERGIPYKRPFVKYTPTWPRSFMPQNQKMRDLVAKMKLLPNEQFTRDQKVLFMDDSIVRGTQLKDNVVKLLDSGVKEVHMRIACPPLIFPCKFLNFSTSRSTYDLYTRRVIRDMEGTDNLTDEVCMQYADPDNPKHKEMVDVMRRHLQLTSLKFQKLEDLVAAIGLPKCELCTHCWDNSSYTE